MPFRKGIKPADMESARRLLKPDKARIDKIVRKLEVPADRRKSFSDQDWRLLLKGEVIKLCEAIKCAALDDNPDAAKPAGTDKSLEELAQLLNLSSSMAKVMTSLHLEADSALEQANASAGDRAVDFEGLQLQLCNLNNLACAADDIVKAGRPTKGKKGRNRTSPLHKAIAKAAASTYRTVTGLPLKARNVDEDTGKIEHTPFRAFLVEIFEALGLDVDMDRVTRGLAGSKSKSQKKSGSKQKSKTSSNRKASAKGRK